MSAIKQSDKKPETLEEFKEILRSRGIVIKISSTKKESNARLKRFTGV